MLLFKQEINMFTFVRHELHSIRTVLTWNEHLDMEKDNFD